MIACAHEYWETSLIDGTGWVKIWCPIMEEGSLSFRVKRKIVKELREIEFQIMKTSLEGWVGHTELKNPHIMVMLRKLGAIPYELDVEEGRLWFKREIL